MIFKRKGSAYYWYKFDLNREHYEASTKTRNKAAAKMIESKRRTDIALGLYGLQPSKPGVALKDYLPKFLEWAKTQNLAPDTTKAYREHLMPILAYKPLADCR